MQVRRLALLLVFCLCAAPAEAKLHALVVGIDAYKNHRPLVGAVNDARDIAAAIKGHVTGEMTMLIDGEANRAGVLGALDKMIDAAAAGDVVFFSYSGHGVAFTDDEARRDEKDGLDEFMAMPSFAEQGANFAEKISDDEIYERLKRADAKQVTVLLVADSCHSGGLARAIGDPSIAQAGLPYRFMQLKTKPQPAATALVTTDAPELAPSTVFLSATSEKLRVQEVLIDDKPRGALSYYVARALEGHADFNHDGALTAAEIRDYVLPNVVEQSRNQQAPAMIMGKAEAPLIVLKSEATATADGAAGKAPPLPELAVMLRDTQVRPTGLDGVKLVRDAASADVVWDANKKMLFNASGDMLAAGISAERLQIAVDAGRTRAALLKMMQDSKPLAIALQPEARLLSAGCHVRYSVERYGFPHFTVLNLAYTGTVQFLFPLASLRDPLLWPAPRPWQVEASVSAPFGSDFLIFIASQAPLTDLHRRLVALHGKDEPVALYEALLQALQGQAYEIGIKSAFTAQEGEPCER